jgi:hypothetical protein
MYHTLGNKNCIYQWNPCSNNGFFYLEMWICYNFLLQFCLLINHNVPLLNYTLVFALQLRKSTENLSQGNRVVRHYSLRRLNCLFSGSLDCPAER